MNDVSRVLTFGRELDREAVIPDIEKVAGLYPRGFLSIYAAPAGTGKTWLMQYLACRISCGGNILNGMTTNAKPHHVVILAGETGKYMLDKRLQSTCWAYNKKRIKVYDCIELQREEIPIMLNTQEGRMTFITICANEKPDIIFIDTLISFHTADESKQGEMTSIYSFLLKSAKTFDCAIVLNHHTRKRNTKTPNARMTQDDVIGSNVGIRLASSVFVAEQYHDETQDDEGMPKIIVHNVKNWDKRIPDFSYKFITDEATGRLDFEIDLGITEDGQNWSLRERVRNFISTYEIGASINTGIIATELKTSEENARRYLDELVQRGKLERHKVLNATMWRVIT